MLSKMNMMIYELFSLSTTKAQFKNLLNKKRFLEKNKLVGISYLKFKLFTRYSEILDVLH